MSSLKDAITGLRKVLVLTEDVKRAGQQLDQIADELRDHDRRLVRIETMIEIAQSQRMLPADGSSS